MADEPSGIPLADVFRAANELVSADLIKDYALGGALAAIYYTEPFTIYRCGYHLRRERQNFGCGRSCDLFAFGIERLARRTRAPVD